MGVGWIETLARIEIDPCSAVVIPLAFCVVASYVLFREERTPGGEADPPRCGECRYDLSGLDRGVVCPECGSTERLYFPPRARWVFIRERRLIVAAALVLMVMYVLAGDGLALLPPALSYRASGYTWDVSMNAARIRDRDEMVAVVPLACGIALSPLASLVKGRRGQIAMLVLLIINAALLALAWWWMTGLMR